ncbi:unnamed protein product [marine sediment metagenome]|uniref:Lipoprotein n=1 Tax=marine sediment metagenome TaxID=412755 RepID=X0TBP4_9ZZZZ
MSKIRKVVIIVLLSIFLSSCVTITKNSKSNLRIYGDNYGCDFDEWEEEGDFGFTYKILEF